MSSIKVKEAIRERKLPLFYILICRYGAKLVAKGSLISGLSHSGTEVLGLNTSMWDAMVATLDDHTQATVAHIFEKQIRACYKQNSRDTEKQANINNDSTLPVEVGHELIADKKPKVIPDIFFKNSTIIGIMNYRVKAFSKCYNYNFEITQLSKDGTIFSTIERQMTNAKGIMDGFVSGAMYMIRCQPIFTNNEKGEWTEYFEIRAN
ncbi:MAG: hypothetical protein WCL51_05510 [Bacteroidota bacterium]